MYLKFYGLSEKPFSQTPDPKFLYWNDSYREALASLRYGIQERKGFLTMIGEAGTGKTTLLRKLLDDLGPDVVSVFLFNPNASFDEILEYTLSELGIAAPSGRKLAMLQRLNEFLLAAFAEGKNTILLIDEAQDLESDVLESLRLLSNLETSKEKILQIVLSGQPELATRLAQASLRQLKQRISVRCRLEPLARSELAEYIRARLRIAGGDENLVGGDCLDAVWGFSRGIPRLVNTVCDNALLVGYAVGKRAIDREVVEEVVADLARLDVAQAPADPAAREAIGHGGAADGTSARAPERSAAAPSAPRNPAPVGLAAPREDAVGAPSDASSPPRPPGTPTPSGGGRDGEAVVVPQIALPPRSRLSSRVAFGAIGACLLLVGIWIGAALKSDRGDPLTRGEPRLASRTQARTPRATSQPSVRPALETRPGGSVGAPEESVVVRDDAATAGPQESGELPFPAVPRPQQGTMDSDSPAGGGAPAARRLESLPGTASRVGGGTATTTTPLDGVPSAEPTPAVEGSPGGRAAPSPAAAAPAAATNGPAFEPPAAARADTRPGERTAGPSSQVARTAATPQPLQDVQLTGRGGSRGVRPVVVRPGDTLYELAIRTYGSANLTTLDMLRAANPGIDDVNKIMPGRVIVFPDAGPGARIVAQGDSFSILAVTTPTLDLAHGVQRKLQAQFGGRVEVETVMLGEGQRLYRVSLRDLQGESRARQIADFLGSILRDPDERPGS